MSRIYIGKHFTIDVTHVCAVHRYSEESDLIVVFKEKIQDGITIEGSRMDRLSLYCPKGDIQEEIKNVGNFLLAYHEAKIDKKGPGETEIDAEDLSAEDK